MPNYVVKTPYNIERQSGYYQEITLCYPMFVDISTFNLTFLVYKDCNTVSPFIQKTNADFIFDGSKITIPLPEIQNKKGVDSFNWKMEGLKNGKKYPLGFGKFKLF